MYTSDKNEIIHYADSMLHDAFIFLAAGILSAVFGLIYEIFSHEVYSFYMIYAFLILLVPGALLNLLIVWSRSEGKRRCGTGWKQKKLQGSFFRDVSPDMPGIRDLLL